MNRQTQDKAYKERDENRNNDRTLKRENARRYARLRFFGVVVTLCFCYLIGRIFYLKYVYGNEYEKRAIENQFNSMEKVLAPVRGAILDRNNQTLVISHSVDRIILDPRNLAKEKKEVQDKTLAAINKHLGIPMSTLEGYLAKDADGKLINDNQYTIIARGISKNVSRELLDSGIKCVYTDDDSKRTYVQNTLASTVIGMIRGDGSWGLENQYDKELSGTPGRLFNTFENTNSVANQIPAEDGYTLVTTIDSNIQQIAEKAVMKAVSDYEPQDASVIVMNPKTGEVLAMAESNRFDPSQPSNIDLFTDMRVRAEMAELTDDELLYALYKTWGNFNISVSLEPGSTFKPIVVAAALEENLISETTTYYCNGGKNVLDRHIQCWIAKYPAGRHGNVTLASGLAQSCNVMLMDIGAQLGSEKYYKYQHDFGFGEKTGIDLPGEMSAASLLHTLSGLKASELATGSIGQGFNATPIQVINAFAAIINGGNLMTPYIVSNIVDSDGNVVKETTPAIQRRVISENTSYYMRNAMRDVVDAPNGTGRRAAIEGYSIGGKTGTAEQTRGEEEDEYALSFIAYLPAENPEIIALAIINRPKDYYEGSTSTAPMLKEVLVDIIKYRGMQPTAAEADQEIRILEGNEVTLENFVGLNTVEASKIINKTGMKYEIVGSGDIVDSQQPAAGVKVSADGMVWLYLRSSSPEAEIVMIPDVKGIPVEMAVEILKTAGFTSIVEEDFSEAAASVENKAEQQDGDKADTQVIKYVTQEYPSPGIKVAPGTEIKLKIK